MYFAIRHITEFVYSAAITESVMEVRMQPRDEPFQRCLSFRLDVSPRAQILTYRDHLNNAIQHFDVPGRHRQLVLTAEALVEARPNVDLPETLPSEAWAELDEIAAGGEFWDSLAPSRFARPTPLLRQLAQELHVSRRTDPLTLAWETNIALYHTLTYAPESTHVDSPIDDTLTTRRGVCQDYTHIMTALMRLVGVPCRYVSGYLYHREEEGMNTAEDSTHAWVEVYLPNVGWVGFDPTNNQLAGEQHIRVAIGRDYADVPPTRGVFKGTADTKLRVGVGVYPTEQLPHDEELIELSHVENVDQPPVEDVQQQQQQQ
jgi:transglutaminase-like putative cysteine protease